MKDFGYFGELDFPLNDEICVCNNSNESFIVANDKCLNAEIYAPEINHYIANCDENALIKAKNISLLYESRALGFDLSKYQKMSKNVGKNVLIVGEKDEVLERILQENGFKTHFEDEIKFIYGCVGELSAILDDKTELECDFALFKKPQPYALRQSGCYDISAKNASEICEILLSKTPIYQYQNYVGLDSDLCLYHHKRGEICAACASLCPSVAILKNTEQKELVLSPIDCVACGRCVSICPSGAMENLVLTRASVIKIASLYKGKTPLLMCETDLANVRFKNNILPFILPSGGVLDFDNLLSVVLGCGSAIIIYLKEFLPAVNESIELANEIFSRAFGKKLIFACSDENKLAKIMDNISFESIGDFELNENLNKFTSTASKLKMIVSNRDLGEFIAAPSISHAKISVDEDKCTLCLSCAGACPTGALLADSTNNALCFNESLCVGCDYCIQSCAEKDTIFITRGKMRLNDEYFMPKVLAKDELFACAMCGKEFATKKAIERVASMMSASFGDDMNKLKSLYCCSDCKAQMMIEAQIKGAHDE